MGPVRMAFAGERVVSFAAFIMGQDGGGMIRVGLMMNDLAVFVMMFSGRVIGRMRLNDPCIGSALDCRMCVPSNIGSVRLMRWVQELGRGLGTAAATAGASYGIGRDIVAVISFGPVGMAKGLC